MEEKEDPKVTVYTTKLRSNSNDNDVKTDQKDLLNMKEVKDMIVKKIQKDKEAKESEVKKVREDDKNKSTIGETQEDKEKKRDSIHIPDKCEVSDKDKEQNKLMVCDVGDISAQASEKEKEQDITDSQISIVTDLEINGKRTKKQSIKAKEQNENKDKLEDNNWTSEPKFWNQIHDTEWTEDAAKEKNGPKCCLYVCGSNNNRDMIRCDWCGSWAHLKCEESERKNTVAGEDYYMCKNCGEKREPEESPKAAESISLETDFEERKDNTHDEKAEENTLETINETNINQKIYTQKDMEELIERIEGLKRTNESLKQAQQLKFEKLIWNHEKNIEDLKKAENEAFKIIKDEEEAKTEAVMKKLKAAEGKIKKKDEEIEQLKTTMKLKTSTFTETVTNISEDFAGKIVDYTKLVNEQQDKILKMEEERQNSSTEDADERQQKIETLERKVKEKEKKIAELQMKDKPKDPMEQHNKKGPKKPLGAGKPSSTVNLTSFANAVRKRTMDPIDEKVNEDHVDKILNDDEWFKDEDEISGDIILKNDKCRQEWYKRLNIDEESWNDENDNENKNKDFGNNANRRNDNKMKCTGCFKEGHEAKDCYYANKLCNSCGKKGHLKRHCKIESERTATEEKKICQLCKKENHTADVCRNRNNISKTTPNSKNAIQCQICKNMGHTADICKNGMNRRTDNGSSTKPRDVRSQTNAEKNVQELARIIQNLCQQQM